MRELQFTPIHNGRMITEKEVRNGRARAYSMNVRRKRAMVRERFGIGLATITGIMFVCIIIGSKIDMEVKAAMETEVQEYIVRYGTTYCSGEVVVTEGGQIWTLEDAPEFDDGTEVRVLFNSNKTETVLDDVIIDVTER